jgi:Papain family cysteine protease
MKYKLLIVACLNLLVAHAFAQTESYDNSSGLDLDDASYATVPLVADYELYGSKFGDDMPLEFSLKSYCPTPNDQNKYRKTPSCVGQALGYGAMTIMYALHNKIMDKNRINEGAFSALFSYNQATQNNCLAISFEQVFKVLKDKGNVLFRNFDNNPTYDCYKKPIAAQNMEAKNYRVKEMMKLFELDPNSNKKDKKLKYNIQKSITSGIPVVVGMRFPQNFETFKGNGYYIPGNTPLEISHGMVVIGYDATGLELMNSYGTNWGDKGFCKMKYADFLKHCYRAYQLVFDKKEVAPVTPPLKAAFEFRTPENGVMIPLEFALNEGKYYQMVRKSTFGQQFQLAALDLQANKCLYIFSCNPAGKVQLHFPKKGTDNKFEVSPLNPYENASLIFPAPKRAFTKQEEGTDYLFVLYSLKEYDSEMINKCLNEMEQLSGRSAVEKFEQAFKSILLDSKNIQYDTNNPLKPSFVTPKTDKMIPIILKVDSE